MSDTNPFAGEFGRHWADHTAEYRWDGHEDGVDMNVWAYAHNTSREAAGFTVVVQQMPPNIVGAGDDAEPATWGVRFTEDDWAFTAGVDEAGGAVADICAERVPFDSLPEDIRSRVWNAVADGHRTTAGTPLAYDLATGTWTTAAS